MSPEDQNLADWIKLLNSGYKQCMGVMETQMKYHFFCAIGLFLKHKVGHTQYDTPSAIFKVAEMTGLSRPEVGEIMEANDGLRYSFSQIANVLQHKLEERTKYAKV